MSPLERQETIEERLQKKFSPTVLEIIDESAKHKGHEGARGGAGHYAIMISADALHILTRIEAHQQIYQVLDDLIPHEIHALRIKILL